MNAINLDFHSWDMKAVKTTSYFWWRNIVKWYHETIFINAPFREETSTL